MDKSIIFTSHCYESTDHYNSRAILLFVETSEPFTKSKLKTQSHA